MPLPPVNTVEVVGTYLRPDGTPAAGWVEFAPTGRLALVAGLDEAIVLPVPVVARLDADGRIAVRLPATDDPTAGPPGWLWRITERTPGGTAYAFALPSDVDPIDVADLAPIPQGGTA